jgi:hypothetical protein
MVHLEQGAYCQGHTFIAYEDREIGLSEFDFHCMTTEDYAYSPPPVNDLNFMVAAEWDKWIEESQPSDDEILISDLSAVELMEEFENEYI